MPGARIKAHDPVAVQEAKRCLALDFADQPAVLEAMSYVSTPMDAVKDADALLIVTEWKVYRSPDFTALKAALRSAIIFDGRNLYEPKEIRADGFEYEAIGR